MKITTQIRLLFVLSILIPVTIFLIITYMVCVDYLSLMYNDDSKNVLFTSDHRLSQTIYDAGDRFYEDVSKTLEENPYILEDSEYLQKLEDETDNFFTYIIIVKDKQVYYHAKVADCKKIEKMLMDNRKMLAQNRDFYYINDLQGVLIRDLSFSFSDGDEGEMFILTDMNQAMIRFIQTFFYMAIICISIIIIMIVVLHRILLHGFLKPVKVLEENLRQMGEGDLNIQMEYNPKNEIGHLAEEVDSMRDTLRKTMDQNILYAESDRTLLMNISHDLKTPLTTIKGYAEGIRDGIASTPEKREAYTNVIVEKVDEMTDLVNEILYQAHLDYDVIPYNKQDVLANEFFGQECNKLYEMQAVGRENIHIEYECRLNRDVYIYIDSKQIKRVLVNLYSNAIKYNEKKTKQIKIIISEQENYLLVEFRDNGIGVFPDNLKKIFERFYRIDPSRNSNTGGNGLGLSIVKKIIEDHGGSTWAENHDVGISIYFTLPENNMIKNLQE